ncbi:MAG: phosphoribosyltransferase family protein [Acidobacteriota bacterium]|jgi:predicted phosphoribosyltransferase|nr:phosphoribosyltransferase family protein [Acidobacteriota bacterium]
MERFRDRRQAGTRVAEELADKVDIGPSAVVLGIPRGGVVVADVVARELDAELDVIAVEKLGSPWNPELAMGAVGEEEAMWIDAKVAEQVEVSMLACTIEAERAELVQKLADIRRIQLRIDLDGRTTIIVDDGVATGSTIRAALLALERARPARRILAVPVGSPETLAELEEVADVVVCPLRPPYFRAVGSWYEAFGQVSQAEVLEIFHQRKGT